jgi:hypothetical protein
LAQARRIGRKSQRLLEIADRFLVLVLGKRDFAQPRQCCGACRTPLLQLFVHRARLVEVTVLQVDLAEREQDCGIVRVQRQCRL